MYDIIRTENRCDWSLHSRDIDVQELRKWVFTYFSKQKAQFCTFRHKQSSVFLLLEQISNIKFNNYIIASENESDLVTFVDIYGIKQSITSLSQCK